MKLAGVEFLSLVKRTVKVLLLLGVVTAALGGGAFAFVVWCTRRISLR